MPRRTDIEKIVILGAGPIIIGQACEFDYSGTQACKALREEGYRVVLVNSNPATIMTDPDFAHRTYIEPLTPEFLAKIIERERPDALLPTLGGQTALNLAVSVSEMGVLEKYGVQLIGASVEAINKAEDRNQFRKAIEKVGLRIPRSRYVENLEDAHNCVEFVGYPAVIRPSFTLGGTGASIAYGKEEYIDMVKWGLDASPRGTVLVEESVEGWKEFELEVMRDLGDNVVIICSIENVDPMGIHTGDSITVAPAQTLTDKEYQIMRDASISIIREIGVDTGGSNIQFAVNPETGEMVVIEMNPRVSRSSALASKATGFPIAKIAAKLAVGYRLNEIQNDITRETPASFEPAIDYVVTKIPRFTFEKFPQTEDKLGTQMKSVGEVMAVGRTFKESLQKALRSLENDLAGLDSPAGKKGPPPGREEILANLSHASSRTILFIGEAFRRGISLEEIADVTGIDPWFLRNIQQIVSEEEVIREKGEEISHILSGGATSPHLGSFFKKIKGMGFSDQKIAELAGVSERDVYDLRTSLGVKAVYKCVDTCAAEFEAYTPYLYSTYEDENECKRSKKEKVIILGAGPNRIGQGIEFDYCCVQSVYSLREDGFETIMVNCNPETVSTDYDTSDKLYFEPLTFEDVMSIVENEDPRGVIVQFGGQTPLKLAVPLGEAGVPILGTSPGAIDRAEDRELFSAMLDTLGLKQPPHGTATSKEDALKIARNIGFPVLLRPSYVLGGRAMEIVHDEASLNRYMEEAVVVSGEKPVLVDSFLEEAIEIDVDAVSDGYETVVAGIMEHIEEAGVHSGDSACSLPPYSLGEEIISEIHLQTKKIARELNVVGLMNIQFALKGEDLFILEVNPRASRTVPFVSKAIGVSVASVATKVMMGMSLSKIGFTEGMNPRHICVKEAVFPFIKFPGVDTLLGPEMKSTGEVMGIDKTFEMAFAKSQIGAGNLLPDGGKAFISVRDEDKSEIFDAASLLAGAGFTIVATRGTSRFLKGRGLVTEEVKKINEGSPNVGDMIREGSIALVINTPLGADSKKDSYYIRRTALVYGVPYFTTKAAAKSAAIAIDRMKKEEFRVQSLQEFHEKKKPTRG